MQTAARVQRTGVQRGFFLLALMTVAFSFAMNAQQNVTTNYFESVLGLRGPQFGYITAIREIPGFLLIFLTALFYRMSLQRLTSLALMLLAVGYFFYGASNSFWTVAPWVIISSMGYHTVLQAQYALGMSLTTQDRSGSILGRMSAIGQGGTLVALVFVATAFHYGWISYRPLFVICGGAAFLAALAIWRFPHLVNGEEKAVAAKRSRIVLRREYRYYYLLSALDGGRQQVFFSFGLFVLVHNYHFSVPQVSVLLIAITFVSMVSGAWVGKMLDKHGERKMLAIVNVAYVFALAGYGFTNNVIVASACYVLYTFIFPLSPIGAATYLRKVAVQEEIAPSLAMGVTMQHAAAIIVPISAGFILNYVGYQIPFMIACGFAVLTFFVTQRLDPVGQRSPARIEADNDRNTVANDFAEAEAIAEATAGNGGEAITGPAAASRTAPVAGD